jgi:hypothetical protein
MIKRFITRRILSKNTKHDLLNEEVTIPDLPMGMDSFYFFGVNATGTAGGVFRLGFSAERLETWLAIYTEDGDLIRLKQETHPPTSKPPGNSAPVFTYNSQNSIYSIVFEGELEVNHSVENVTIDLVFTPKSPFFDFSDLKDKKHLEDVISNQKWNKAFFNRLKTLKTEHIEQGGTLTGTISYKNKQIGVNWRSIRDHSRGERNWENWKQHCWLTGISEKGDCFNVSLIEFDSLPVLRAGYLWSDGKAFPISFAPSSPVSKPKGIIKTAWGNLSGELIYETQIIWQFNMGEKYLIEEGMGTFHWQGTTYTGVIERGRSLY